MRSPWAPSSLRVGTHRRSPGGAGQRSVVADLWREEPPPAGLADLQVDGVGQVEPPLGLHHVGELADDVPVLAIELQLHLGLVLLEVLGAHRTSPGTGLMDTSSA